MVSGPQGLASGLQTGIELGTNIAGVRAEKKQATQERLSNAAARLRERINATVSETADRLKELREAGEDPTGPAGQRIIRLGARQANLLLSSGEELGLPNMPQRQSVLNRFQALSTAQVPLETTRETTAADVAAETRAEEEVRADFRQPERVGNDVDVILDTGERIPADAIRFEDPQSGRTSVLISDEQGTFRPVNEVYPNTIRVEPARVRQEDVGAGEPFSREDFVRPIGEVPLPSFEEGVGPLDVAAGTIINIPVFSQLFTEVFGEEAGTPQRQASRAFKGLRNEIALAFQPGESGRLSNMRLELALQLAPSFGAFAQEKGVEADLRQLLDLAESSLSRRIAIANDPRSDETLRRDAQQSAEHFGRSIEMIEGLLTASRTPQMQVTRALDGPINEASEDDMIRVLRDPEISRESKQFLLDSLSREQKSALLERLKGDEVGDD